MARHVAALLFWVALAGHAQIPRSGRDVGIPEAPPEPRAPTELKLETPKPAVPKLDGRLTVSRFRITGLSAIDPAELEPVLAPWVGREIVAADLAEAVRAVQAHLRGRGWYVAQAYVPDQRVTDGELEIAVVEGRLGNVRLELPEDSRLRRGVAEGMLSGLRPGTPILRGEFDSPLLTLNDLPGVAVRPVLRRGSEPGTADLLVQVADEPLLAGLVRFDNHEVRELGEYQLTGQLRLRNPLGIGDLATGEFVGTHTGEKKLATLSYSAPVNRYGTRLGAVYREQHARLGNEFAPLQARSEWDRRTLVAGHPLWRTHDRNLFASLALSEVRYHDRIDAVGFVNESRHRYANASLAADWTDGLLAGGQNAVQLEYQAGRVYLDTPAVAAADADPVVGLQVAGSFHRWRLSIERIQAFTERTSLKLVLGAQLASKNLDLGRELQISGPEGVRAYPIEELAADSGAVATVELRHVVPVGDRWRVGGAVFFDAGRGKINQEPLPGSVDNVRTLSGYGVTLAAGVRDLFNAEISLAWRTDDAPLTDPDRRPRVWFVLRQLFLLP